MGVFSEALCTTLLLLLMPCDYVAAGACPNPYAVDYEVAKALTVRLQLLDSKDKLIGDASDAMKGSPNGALELAVSHQSVSVVFDLSAVTQMCTQLEIVAFQLTVVGVDSFAVTIGNQSSYVVQVHLLTCYVTLG